MAEDDAFFEGTLTELNPTTSDDEPNDVQLLAQSFSTPPRAKKRGAAQVSSSPRGVAPSSEQKSYGKRQAAPTQHRARNPPASVLQERAQAPLPSNESVQSAKGSGEAEWALMCSLFSGFECQLGELTRDEVPAAPRPVLASLCRGHGRCTTSWRPRGGASGATGPRGWTTAKCPRRPAARR